MRNIFGVSDLTGGTQRQTSSFIYKVYSGLNFAASKFLSIRNTATLLLLKNISGLRDRACFNH